MIIGVSGKIGSGKDTVGEIIQYLTSADVRSGDLASGYFAWTQSVKAHGPDTTTPYEIKKFADKLKDIVCMLIGCTREQLEDRNFKEAPLGPEWDKWGFINHLDGVHAIGKIGDNGLFETEAEAVKAERNMRIAMNWSRRLHSTFEKVQMTPRLMLQLLGTDCGRNIIHPNIWVNSLMADYNPGSPFDPRSGTGGMDASRWIITDTRFPNEADAVLKREGILLRVNRGDGNTGTHPSETALDNYKHFTEVIDNNGSIDDLVLKVSKILSKYKLA